jgi:general secretion pathway protein K
VNVNTAQPASLHAPRAPQGGVALITVLWGTALLIVIVMGLAALVRAQMLTVRQALHSAQARALAEAGVQRALAEITLVPAAQRWRPDGTVHSLQFGEGRVQIALQDVGGLIDLTAAREEIINGMLQGVGVDDAAQASLRDAILDWRDTDNLRRLYGAEDAAYEAAGLDYGAKDRAFDVVEELRQVLGMPADVYRRLEPLVTVYSGRPGINPAWAPAAVLRSLPGLTADAVSAYLDARTALAPGATPGALLGVDPQFLSQGSGDTYRIDAEGFAGGNARAKITATVRVAGTADRLYTVLSWRE